MKPNTARAINVFLSLTNDEKKEFLKKLESFNTNTPYGSSKDLQESYDFAEESKRLNLTLGPTSGRCPYCGK